MGLGKTIQIIALMVANQRNSRHQVNNAGIHVGEDEDELEAEVRGEGKLKAKANRAEYGKTTLIVAPASLLHQACISLLQFCSITKESVSGEKRSKPSARTVFCVFIFTMENASLRPSKS